MELEMPWSLTFRKVDKVTWQSMIDCNWNGTKIDKNKIYGIKSIQECTMCFVNWWSSLFNNRISEYNSDIFNFAWILVLFRILVGEKMRIWMRDVFFLESKNELISCEYFQSKWKTAMFNTQLLLLLVKLPIILITIVIWLLLKYIKLKLWIHVI